MKKYYFLTIGVVSLIFISFFVASAKENNPLATLTYPISELDSCNDRNDCMAFCEKTENMQNCIDFAEKNNLLSKEDIEMAKNMIKTGETAGPGGCKGILECRTYCNTINNIEECLVFAEDNNLLSPEELVDGKKVIQAMKQGFIPPSCNNRQDCTGFCRLPDNMEQCLTFVEAAGLLPEAELTEAKKALEAVKKGAKMPACGGEDCKKYCAADEHFKECITFAEAAGFVTTEEAIMAKKIGGKGPGGCKGKDECEKYCENSANGEECINFALEYGFMSSEDAATAKKMLAVGLKEGPGGCKGNESCKKYCDELLHQKECTYFALKAGLMSAEDAEKVKKMTQAGFKEGPGGCKGNSECKEYCNEPDHMEECLDFGQKTGIMSVEDAQNASQGIQMMKQGGPGGCRGTEGCVAYCADPAHLEECANFAGQQGLISTEELNKMKSMMRQAEELPAGISLPKETVLPSSGGFVPSGGFTKPPTQQQIQYIKEQEMQKQIQQMKQQQQLQQQKMMEQMKQQIPPSGGIPSGYGPPQ